MNKNTKSKYSQWIIILFLGTNICSCSKENTETEIIPVYNLKTEFVKTMDLTDDIGFTFQYQHDSTDTYLCRYSTYFLRKSQTVENISVKRQGNELWINVDGSDACWSDPFDRNVMIYFRIYNLPAGEYRTYISTDNIQENTQTPVYHFH